MRNRAVPPTFHSELGQDEQGRQEFLRGAALLGLRLDPEADPMAPGVIKPQQLVLSDLLDVPHDAYAIELARRGAKTTSILCKLLGRCLNRPGYQVTFMAQNGVMGSRRLRDWKTKLDLVTPEDDSLPPWLRGKRRPSSQRHLRSVALFGDDMLPEPEQPEHYGRGFRILSGEVGKGIYFDNGSQLLVFKPEAGAVRGEAADVTWLDEAQELDPLVSEDLMAGLLPLMDTKPGAAMIVSGTAGEVRKGALWDHLQLLRSGELGDVGDVGGADWTAGDHSHDGEPIDWDELQDEDRAMAILATVHPGMGTLTTEAKMRKNYRRMALPQWAREYLSVWPQAAGARVIASDWWLRGQLPEHEQRPSRVAFGLDIRPNGATAAVAAAWRDDEGVAHIELVDHRQGTQWIGELAQRLAASYPGSSIAYDDIGEGRATAAELLNLRPRPRLQVQPLRDQAAGCVQILRDLERGTLRHPQQRSMDAAVAAAAKRELRGSPGSWLWTTAPGGDDVCPLVAATRALRHWDQHMAQAPRRRGVIVA